MVVLTVSPFSGYTKHRVQGSEEDRSHALYTFQEEGGGGGGAFVEVYRCEHGYMTDSRWLNLPAYLNLRAQCRTSFPATSALSDRKLLLLLTYLSLRQVLRL